MKTLTRAVQWSAVATAVFIGVTILSLGHTPLFA
jgi:hypothetical protein